MKILIKHKTSSNADKVFFFAYFLIFFCEFYNTTTFIGLLRIDSIMNLLRLLALTIIVGKIILFDKYKPSKLILIVIVLCAALISYIITQSIILFDFSILLLGSKGINDKEFIRKSLIVGMIFLLITMVASLTGVIENYATYRAGSDSPRYAFGIVYTTDFAAHVFFLILAFDYVRKSKIKFIDVALRGIIVVALDRFCDARFSEIMIVLETIVFWMYGFKKCLFKKKWFSILAIVIAPASAFLSFITVYLYDPSNPIMLALNELLFSRRLSVTKAVMDRNGITFFGNMIVMQGQGYKVNGFNDSIGVTYIDSSYMQILLRYGVIFFTIYIILYCLFIKKSLNTNNYKLAIVLALIAFTGIMNQYMIYVAWNSFAAIMGTYIFAGNSNGKNAIRETISTSYTVYSPKSKTVI